MNFFIHSIRLGWALTTFVHVLCIILYFSQFNCLLYAHESESCLVDDGRRHSKYRSNLLINRCDTNTCSEFHAALANNIIIVMTV